MKKINRSAGYCGLRGEFQQRRSQALRRASRYANLIEKGDFRYR